MLRAARDIESMLQIPISMYRSKRESNYAQEYSRAVASKTAA